MSNIRGLIGKDNTRILIIQKVLERIEDHSAGLPAIVIQDHQGVEQTISYIDVTGISRDDFEKLSIGDEFAITIREQIAGITVKTKRHPEPTLMEILAIELNSDRTQ